MEGLKFKKKAPKSYHKQLAVKNKSALLVRLRTTIVCSLERFSYSYRFQINFPVTQTTHAFITLEMEDRNDRNITQYCYVSIR